MTCLGLICMGGCVSPLQRARSIANSHNLESVTLQGTEFRHRSFARMMGSDLLVIFVEGDGSPWIQGGSRISQDPTPHNPLALELAGETPASVLYLGRPCYFEESLPPGCTPALWTSARYSTRVVDSMAAAARHFLAQHPFAHVLLVGYSGGATIAALMAADIPHLSGFVGIAGNFDPDAWARFHGYLPLDGLNPALRPVLPPQIPQWYLVGNRDSNIPLNVNRRYLDRISPDRIWNFPTFDHRCCWVQQWPAIVARVLPRVAGD